MTVQANPDTRRAVLIGVGNYSHADMAAIPAATCNIEDLAMALTSEGAAFECDACSVIDLVEDPDAGIEIGAAVSRAAKEATEVLLVYYAGHGFIDRRGRLHLALAGTDPGQITWTTLPFERIREEILDSAARTRILILDCCFAGSAFEALSGEEGVMAGQLEIRGTYTLVSSGPNEPSIAPLRARNTAFTGALLAAARTRALTLDELYRETVRLLQQDGYPRPLQRGIDTAASFRLFGGVKPTSAVDLTSDDSLADLQRLALDTANAWEIEGGSGHDELSVDTGADGWLLEQRGEVDKAEVQYRGAAAAGNIAAANNLGVLLFRREQYEDAEVLFRRAVDEGNIAALNNQGLLCILRKQRHEAETLFRRGAESGDVAAMYNLAVMVHGLDGTLAENLYREAASRGNAAAMNSLGCLLHMQGGAPPLPSAEVVYWFQRAVQNANAKAAVNLGVLFNSGGDTEKAESWYQRAAALDSPVAMVKLAVLYERSGRLDDAMAWYRRAVKAERLKIVRRLWIA